MIAFSELTVFGAGRKVNDAARPEQGFATSGVAVQRGTAGRGKKLKNPFRFHRLAACKSAKRIAKLSEKRTQNPKGSRSRDFTGPERVARWVSLAGIISDGWRSGWL
jgi:hypothetical protein